jgi:hypothetical protein
MFILWPISTNLKQQQQYQKKIFLKEKFFGPNLKYMLLFFYDKISSFTIILKFLNKFPTTQLVYNQNVGIVF